MAEQLPTLDSSTNNAIGRMWDPLSSLSITGPENPAPRPQRGEPGEARCHGERDARRRGRAPARSHRRPTDTRAGMEIRRVPIDGYPPEHDRERGYDEAAKNAGEAAVHGHPLANLHTRSNQEHAHRRGQQMRVIDARSEEH